MTRNPVPWPGDARRAGAFPFDMALHRAECDAMGRCGRLRAAVWRPFLGGRPARCLASAERIGYRHARGRVRFARLDEIAAHAETPAASGEWTPRVERLPCCPGPIPEPGEAAPGLAR